MFYTWGYQKSNIEDLHNIINEYKIDLLVDIRSKPYSKYKKEFNKDYLKNVLKEKYKYAGYILGGFNIDKYKLSIKDKENFKNGLNQFVNFSQQGKNILFMCFEKEIKECHREIVEWLSEEKTKHLVTKRLIKNKLNTTQLLIF